jgi:hypothetical protein
MLCYWKKTETHSVKGMEKLIKHKLGSANSFTKFPEDDKNF